MKNNRKKERSHTIITQLESWETSYSVNSEESIGDYYFDEHLEIFANVIYSENKKIKMGDVLHFYIFIYHDLEALPSKPKLVSVFNHSKNDRTATFGVHPTFLENFKFLVNQNIKPYFPLTCKNDIEKRDILIEHFNIESNVIIDDYKTC